MIQEPFSDFRPGSVLTSQRSVDVGPSSRVGLLVPFVVMVRREEAFLVRINVLDVSRYLAARQAEEALLARELMQGTSVVVAMDFDPQKPAAIGEECQGPCQFTVLLETPHAVRTAVSVWASSRASAIELAKQRSPLSSRPVLARVRYRSLGRCKNCGVAVFEDVKHRQVRNGCKCFDCG